MMKFFQNRYIKIITSLILSLFVVLLIYNSRSIVNRKMAITSLLSNVKFGFPKYDFSSETSSSKSGKVKDTSSNQANFSLPTAVVGTKEESNEEDVVESVEPTLSEPTEVVLYRPTINPKDTPKPTKRPRPTPTPLAPPEDMRPGADLDDIFKKAAELSCVPDNLLKAFVANEAPGVLNWSKEQALFYNSYNWWHRVKTLKEVCAGYGWYTQTGLVAEDSLFAGERCKEPFSAATANDTYSKSLGATQMLKSYWDKYYAEPTKQKLKVKQVDRRVLIDSLIGFGIHLRKDSGYSGQCDNWELKDIAKAACVNTGVSCDFYNYCYTICNNYNKFSKKSFNCDGVKNYFVSGTCQFK